MTAVATTPINPPQWTPANVTYGAHKGCFAVRLWTNLINYNNFEGHKPPLNWAIPVIMGMSIFGSLARASDVFYPELELGKSQDIFASGTSALIMLNMITIARRQTHKKISEIPSTIDKFLVVVWKATPYVMLITNVALIILDLRKNIVIGMVSLATAGISLVDLTRWKPKDFDWYLDFGVRVPLNIATMYYHQPLRAPIILGLALDPGIRAIFSNVIQRWT